MPQDPALRTPAQTTPGGILVVEVGRGVDSVEFGIPGHGWFRLKVVRGRVEFRVPESARGGTPVFVSDGRIPKPTTSTVWVVDGLSP